MLKIIKIIWVAKSQNYCEFCYIFSGSESYYLYLGIVFSAALCLPRRLPLITTNRLQPVLNSAARAVTKTHKIHHIAPIPKSLHWLKINERIKYKVLSRI